MNTRQTHVPNINEEANSSSEMGQSGNTLHFDGVHLLEGVVKNSGGIDDLIPEVLVVQVTNEQALGCLPSIRECFPGGFG